MKKNLLDSILCPCCKAKFNLDVFKQEEGEIVEGVLFSSCGKSFPIINGIPRILSDNLMGPVKKRFPDFFIEHKNIFLTEKDTVKSLGLLKKQKTSESFGFEWEKFSEMREEWKKNFDFYFEPVDLSNTEGKTALELGCGNGRHTVYASKIFKELISVDLSLAIDVAHSNNRNQSNVHFVQADIYDLPFADKFFDFAFCIGVLHHLPNPESGFMKLVSTLNNHGNILIYVYHKFSKTTFNFYLLGFVNFFRRITTNLPHKALFILSYPIALLSYIILILPYKLLFRNIIKNNWPLGGYADYSFSVILNDTFDRFSAPIENRYYKEQILNWFKRANLHEVKILGGSGWRISGKK